MSSLDDFDACTTFNREGDEVTISCKLGLWSVTGNNVSGVLTEAVSYFMQYRDDGEYSGIIGGPTVEECLLDHLKTQPSELN